MATWPARKYGSVLNWGFAARPRTLNWWCSAVSSVAGHGGVMRDGQVAGIDEDEVTA
ncbi:hypothetical protein [Nonomuraea insulae]|uniref:Uncharacterized protein n=1 Tax=Nonomuraea insulae TaxID=1616787 RepID=A0ABW1CMF9_9ACTN